ncbi:MAG TPA: PAS domain-containing sensor histidine kinase [Stellaceae bacterium]|nr:PAS domain-containing sensor histidine kinase [Stellaceae bacterium]
MADWSRRVDVGRKVAVGITLLAIASGILTYLALTGAEPLGRNPMLVRILIRVDLVLLLPLVAVVAAGVVRIWAERRAGAAGSRMHTRIVALFSIVAVAPAIVVAAFSALFINLALETWFSEPISTAVEESVAVAEAYIGEHRKTIQADVLAMAADLNRDALRLASDPALLNQVMNTETRLRSLSEAMLFDRTGRVLARAGLDFATEVDRVPQAAIDKASQGEVVILTENDNDRVRALVRLDNFLGTYLYVGRFLEPKVLSHLERTREAASEYRQLESQRSGVEITFAVIFIVLSLLVLLSAISFGLAIATRLVKPISGMIDAAERVRAGDLSARVAERPVEDEMNTLGRAFNRMTAQLESQRTDLVEANQQLDQRRRFTEAVLAGVSAGVVGVDRDGRINLPNPSAIRLLGTTADKLIGKPFVEAVPEMAELFIGARDRPDRPVQAQINIMRGARARNLLVGVVTETAEDGVRGYVITFDDITELVSAQRTAAWADVARRIAHEIKNPLTPIQLSAERLRRKYMKEIATDPEVFSKCTETIIRQVGDIGRMVDEFSSFARLPAPVFRDENLTELVRQALFLQQVGHPEIDYVFSQPDAPVPLRCDGRQIAQVLTNLLQNAADAIEGRRATDTEAPKGRIEVQLRDHSGEIDVDVIDNGRGLPVEHRERLTEPYVTTRLKGTGLGLAIVKKIMEEHGGALTLEDADGGGARIRLAFHRAQAPVPANEPGAAGGERVRHGA